MNELKADHPFADLLPGEVPLLPCGVLTTELEGLGTTSVVFCDLKQLPLARIVAIAERFAEQTHSDPLEVIVELVREGMPIRCTSFRSPPVILIDARLVT